MKLPLCRLKCQALRAEHTLYSDLGFGKLELI